LEQEQWSKKISKFKDWLVWCQLKSMEKKCSQTTASKPNPKQERRRISKEATGTCSQCAGKRGGDRATSNAAIIIIEVSEEYASCWVHQDCETDCHVADEQKAALKKAAEVSGGNDECQARLKGRQRNYWMGTEIGMLGGYGCQGQVTAGEVQTNKAKWEQDIIT